MIYIVDGYAGHGKTSYVVAKWLFPLLKSGERIFSDIKIFPENMKKEWTDIEGDIAKKEDRENPEKKILYWKHFEDWQYMKQGTILCDEGGVKFNSRNFEKLPEEIQNKIMQHRHERLDLILTAPHWTRIDLMIRQMTERFLHFELIMGSPKFEDSWVPRITKLTEHHLEDMVRMENLGKDSNLVSEPLFSEYFWIRKKYFSWYDTGEIVGGSRPMRSARLCPHHKEALTYCPECERIDTYLSTT